MAKMLKIILIALAAFVVVDAFAFDGYYLAWFLRRWAEIWYKLNHINWMP